MSDAERAALEAMVEAAKADIADDIPDDESEE